MVTTRHARTCILLGGLGIAALALVAGCAIEPPSHTPWPTLTEGGSSTKTGLEGGKGTLPIAEEKGKGEPAGGSTADKDAGGTEN